MTALLAVGCGDSRTPPRVRAGLLDLSTWRFASGGSVPVEGDWEICWGRHVPPGSSECPGRAWESFPVPRLWSDAGVSSPIGARGIASYRTTLVLPLAGSPRTLRVGSPMTAYRLWINGEPAGGSGTVGTNAETTVPRLENRNYRLPAGVSRVELLVHVANFDFRGGGLRRRWSVGLDDQITEQASYQLLRYAAFATMSGVIGLVFLLQFAFRPSDVTRGWFAVATILIGLRVVFANTSDLHQLLTDWGSFGLSIRLEYLNTALIIFAGLGYFQTKIPGVMPLRPTKLVQLAALALVPLHLLAPGEMVLATLPVIQALALIASLLAMASWGRAYRRRVPGAGSTLAAGLAFSIGVAHDVFRTRTGLGAPIEVFPFFVIVWIASESHSLLQSFARSFANVEKRSDQLEDSNFELQETEEAVVRFLPVDFLRVLGKESIRDVNAGDHAQIEMTVMSCNLDVSEHGSAARTFGLVSQRFSRVEPLIREHGGFLSQQHGDTVVALFPNSADEAVEAAIEIQQAVDDPVGRARPAPSGGKLTGTSIGIASGPVLLGTVGSGESLSSVAIGPTMDLVRRIQQAARRAGASILVSNSTRDRLGENSDYLLREMAPLAEEDGGEASAIFELRPANRERANPARE